MNELPPISLDGFDPPFRLGEYEWGPPVDHDDEPWKQHRWHVETLALYDHDHLGTHMYAQVWDYGSQTAPGQRWQYVLFLHRNGADGWRWVIQREYAGLPSYRDVGDDVDTWVTAPPALRFVLE